MIKAMPVFTYHPDGGLRGLTLPCPQSPFEMPVVGRNDENRLLNGDLAINRSIFRPREPIFAWDGPWSELNPIIDLVDGIYDRAPFYMLNPFAVSGNLLPKQWSLPGRTIQQRGTHAVAAYTPPTPFPASSNTVMSNPRLSTGSWGSPVVFSTTHAMRVVVARNDNRVPDLTYKALVSGNYPVPFAAVPIPAGYGARLTAWGTVATGQSPIKTWCNATTLPVFNNDVGVTTLTPTATGASVTWALDASNARLLLIWLGVTDAAVNLYNESHLAGMDLRILAGGTPGTLGAGPFQIGRGWNPLFPKGGYSLSGYGTPSLSMKRQGAFSFDAVEGYLPW